MSKEIKVISAPDQISKEWDFLADSFYMTKAFLSHLHTFNFCDQRYYELYDNGILVYGTVVYTLKVNLLTFSKLKWFLKMHVIGIPVSIATPPYVGKEEFAEYLIDHILNVEKGLFLGINFTKDYCTARVANMRTLPTIVMDVNFEDFETYKRSIRYPYRRRLTKHESHFKTVESKTTSCFEFTDYHYRLYLDIMKRTKTKLEILSSDFFKNLPENFKLTSHYLNEKILAWQIVTVENSKLYFLFGGMDYENRDTYSSYYNNLLGILKFAVQNRFKTLDFGQTAELAKLRLGGEISERRMFLHHSNKFLNWIIKKVKSLIEYSYKSEAPKVFKQVKNVS